MRCLEAFKSSYYGKQEYVHATGRWKKKIALFAMLASTENESSSLTDITLSTTVFLHRVVENRTLRWLQVVVVANMDLDDRQLYVSERRLTSMCHSRVFHSNRLSYTLPEDNGKENSDKGAQTEPSDSE